jgi:hypothetical protein
MKLSDQFPKRPENITESDWVKICMESPDPDHLVPCVAYGFDALAERVKSQKAMQEQLVNRMKLVQAKLREMTSFYATELRGTFERIQQNRIVIAQNLMEVMEIEEVRSQHGRVLNPQETKMLRELEEKSLDLSRPGNYLGKIRELRAEAARRGGMRKGLRLGIDEATLSSLVSAVKNNQNAIEALERVTKKVGKSVSVVEAVLSELI